MRYADRIQAPTHAGKAFFLFIFFCLLFALSAFSQSKEEKKLRLKGIKALNAGKYEEAEAIYTDLLALDGQNPDYNYEMGLAIFEGGVFRGKAAKYFERAILNTKSDTLPDMFLYAARAEQHAGNFDIAIEYYNDYRSILRSRQIDLSTVDFNIDRAIEMCRNGKVQFENSKDHIKIENMGAKINSEYADYSPVVTQDESIILFTSRRKNSTGGDIANDQKYYEDIYYSINIDGQWTIASNVDSTSKYMNSFVNTETHDATITFAGDETQLYIYRDLDVWISTKSNGRWGIPVKASGNINSARGFEPSIFITQDEQMLFVVSDIGTGYGGRDIYIAKKDPNGNWTTLKNLGKTINTKFDEDAPFLTPDGNTLYFASNGHNSIGDYDIFKSEIDENGNFSAPENLGPPINTPGHDRYFVTTDNGAIGYYASDRPGGFGETDIYRIILDCKSVSATIIRGLVFSEDQNKPVYATIEIYDPISNELINTYIASKETGIYEMRLKTDKTYKFNIRAEGYLPHEGEFTVPQQCDYFDLFQEIKVKNLTDTLGRVYAQRATINNAFFNIDKKIEERFAELPKEELSIVEKDSLRSLLAMETSPIEITNYIKLLDILDPNGIRLASEVIGNKDVATIQTRDFINQTYSEQIITADGLFYENHLPEARAEYLIASAIKPQEVYPKQQVAVIDERLKDEPMEALLSTMPEVDNSSMVDASTRPVAKKQDLSVAHIKGLVFNVETNKPHEAKLMIYDAKTNALVQTVNIDSKEGEYELDLATNTTYKFVVSAPNYKELDGEFFVPEQNEKFDLYQEIRLENLKNEDQVYAQKAIINNAFFNVDQKIIESYPNLDFISLSENQIDSLRFLVTEQTKPIQTTKFVKILDVRDPEGMILAHEQFGYYAEPTISKSQEQLYQEKIKLADKFLAENKFAEAHAYYLVARTINPNDEYSFTQIENIEERLKNQPLAAWLAYDPEVDRSQFIEPASTAAVESKPAATNPVTETPKTEAKEVVAATPAASEQKPEAGAANKTNVANTVEAKAEEIAAVNTPQQNNPEVKPAANATTENKTAEVATVNTPQVEQKNTEVATQTNSANSEKPATEVVQNQAADQAVASTKQAATNEANNTENKPEETAAKANNEIKPVVATVETKNTETKADAKDVATVEPNKAETANKPVAKNEATTDANPAATVASTEPKNQKPSEPKTSVKEDSKAIASTNTASTKTEVKTASTSEKPAEAPSYTPGQKVVFRNILFDFDKSDLREASVLELKRISDYMRLTPGMDLRIDGHADWIGSIEYNLALSERRAQRAYYFLISEGISEGRLTYQFFGESLPVAPNANADGSDNPAGRQLNRRCEFKLDETGTADNVIMRF